MRKLKKTPPRSVVAAIATLTAVALAACGGGSTASKSPAQAPAVSSVPRTAAVRSPEVVASPRATAAASAARLSIVATNVLFDKQQLSAAAGTVAIDLDNQDSGVPHNVHLFNGHDAKGASLGATAVEAGPVKQSLKLDLVTGQYFYQCDVHPTTMVGTITVS